MTSTLVEQLSGLSTGRSEESFAVTELGVAFDLVDFILGSIYDVMPNGDQFVWATLPDVVEETSGLRIIVVENWFEELTERVPVP